MKISGIAKYFAVYLGSWRNFIWEYGGIPFGKMAEFHLGSWRNFIWEDGGEEVVWNRGLNRSIEVAPLPIKLESLLVCHA